jgi:hypothetical protein
MPRLNAGLISRTLNSGDNRLLMPKGDGVVEMLCRSPTGDVYFFFQDQSLLGEDNLLDDRNDRRVAHNTGRRHGKYAMSFGDGFDDRVFTQQVCVNVSLARMGLLSDLKSTRLDGLFADDKVFRKQLETGFVALDLAAEFLRVVGNGPVRGPTVLFGRIAHFGVFCLRAKEILY